MTILSWVTMVVMAQSAGDVIRLPRPDTAGGATLAMSLASRRSVRSFGEEPLTVAQIGQLLWAAQGMTDAVKGLRTAPSSGALYPLETFVVLPEGAYRYNPQHHELSLKIQGDLRHALQKAALNQRAVGDAPAVVVFAAVYERVAVKYKGRATRYVDMEAGHACQNLLLQAAALKLGAVPVGAFHDDRIGELLKLPKEASPLYLVPVGYPKR
ncbi:SagB/ThcOx family dehydrogenase [Desulfoluna spongiiphila]|uniref:SagB-type dehydrogenase domain-containing protein n=1 Tax=Desulfoluna spongiiphila TaxID=419481 RepID=A0A1G5J1F7_9BACT|nr:SagB/ThcOx family dehydrogenase [Desulfoluna spongiiphila]SCY81790.1 SagB-type dehydrogenase domain-containing protein [Desulfoluna spongiiphila]VVS91761.1 nitroreductase [Desulfoluna spongiiphila]